MRAASYRALVTVRDRYLNKKEHEIAASTCLSPIGSCWDLYDEVVVAPIEDFLEAVTETWDAILLLDVLEHFPHAGGEEILAAAHSRLTRDGQFFVGTPAM